MDGSVATVRLNRLFVKARWVSLLGSAFTDWLKAIPSARWVRVDGRVVTGWLKLPPKER